MKLPSKPGAAKPLSRDTEDLINLLNDAVYLTDHAARNHRDDVRPAAPRIRVQPERVKRDPPAATNKGLMSRWFRRGNQAPSNDDPEYQPARIERPAKGNDARPAPAAGATAGARQDQAPASPVQPRLPETKRRRFGFGRKPAPAASPARPVWNPTKRKKIDRGDVTVAALGITLGLTCALFPWYIFLNQEKFGVREMVFEGSREGSAPAQVAFQPPLIVKPFEAGEAPKMNLDFFPTATLPADDLPPRIIAAANQPFPSDLVGFKLVHVANGRAMIEDGDGLWVVQPGSRLPDASRVASIEKRDGRWVLVTSLDKVVELQP
ncbi:hypothetical protein [Mesorhizobium sp. CAU 1732]|uniref:hypothetical protein n=1 Tax=Mesorhizobium sp. CAU 1732 TaxID=3140358 RepID=UPI003260479E